jgi:hypothetical protein
LLGSLGLSHRCVERRRNDGRNTTGRPQLRRREKQRNPIKWVVGPLTYFRCRENADREGEYEALSALEADSQANAANVVANIL